MRLVSGVVKRRIVGWGFLSTPLPSASFAVSDFFRTPRLATRVTVAAEEESTRYFILGCGFQTAR